MFGRFSLDATLEDLYIALKIRARFNLQPRYNIAPGQPVLALRNHPERVARELAHFRWGLIPAWMKEAPKTVTMINARVETIGQKPSFRDAYRRRRCLIPATGFYEWRGEAPNKQPYYIYLEDTRVFAFAGIWEHWQGPDGAGVETVAILTADAAPSIRALHNRMPVIVPKAHFDAWLRAGISAREVLDNKIEFSYYPVSRAVNNVQNDNPSLIGERPPDTPELPV